MMWLDEQWNIPARTDHYLMQVACEVRRGNSKRPRGVKMKDFHLEFKTSKPKRRLSREEQAALSKSRWLGFMTAPVKHVER